jgi:hypothetical protein
MLWYLSVSDFLLPINIMVWKIWTCARSNDCFDPVKFDWNDSIDLNLIELVQRSNDSIDCFDPVDTLYVIIQNKKWVNLISRRKQGGFAQTRNKTCYFCISLNGNGNGNTTHVISFPLNYF